MGYCDAFCVGAFLLLATRAMSTVAQTTGSPCAKSGIYYRYPWDNDLTKIFPGCSYSTDPTTGHACYTNSDGTYTCSVYGELDSDCKDSSGNCVFSDYLGDTTSTSCTAYVNFQTTTDCTATGANSLGDYADNAQACIVGGRAYNCWWTAAGCLNAYSSCGLGTADVPCDFAQSMENCRAAQCSWTEGTNVCNKQPTGTPTGTRAWMLSYEVEGILFGTYAGDWTTNTADSQLACGEDTTLGYFSSGSALTGIYVKCCDTSSLGTITCYSEAYYSGGQWYLAAQLNGAQNTVTCDIANMPTVVCASAASVVISKFALMLAAAVAAVRHAF